MRETAFDARIKELKDWRGRMLARVREIIRVADPEIIEEWKWVKPTASGIPVWSHSGIVCTGKTYKDKVKMTFAKGARLKHPAREQHGKNYALAKPLTEVARRMSANNGMDYPVQPPGKDLVTEQNATRPQRHNYSDTEIR